MWHWIIHWIISFLFHVLVKRVCQNKCCLCAGADSDWYHLEFVTCWEDHAQRVERAWVWRVKSHNDKTASPLINLLVVQMNNKYLRVQTVNTCVYSNMLLCSNKLNVILLTTASSYKLCNFSAYTIKHHSCPSSCGVSGSLSWHIIEPCRNVHLIFMNTHIDYRKLMETAKLFLFICLYHLYQNIPFCWCTLLTV